MDIYYSLEFNLIKEVTLQPIGLFDKGLKFFYLYLSIVGLFSFSCFICEEALQALMFANFSCSDSNRYDLTKKNIERMSKINNHLLYTNKLLLILQPIQYLAYSDYIEATNSYISSIKAEVLANDPSLYLGEHLDIHFYYKHITKKTDHYLLSNGKISIKVSTLPEQTSIRVSGRLRKDKSRYILTSDQRD